MKKIIKKIIIKYKILSKIFAAIIINRDERKKILQIMSHFYSENIMQNKKYVNKIVNDVFFCYLYYRIEFKEYFLYNFNILSDVKRREFIGILEKKEIMNELARNKEEYKNILNDKYKSYLKFKEYYKREIIKINDESDKNIFENFCKVHESFLVKPINLQQGKGIYIINQRDYKSLNDIWSKILKENGAILEEIIIQLENELSKFHPNSVNTVRIITYNKDNIVTKIGAILRMGRGDSIVDNISAGGIMADIDMETGIITSPGITFDGKKYLKHPDTDICIIGYQIPKWKELCEMAESAAKRLPEYEYISWDFALSNKGWMIIEGNAEGSFLAYQIFNGGIRTIWENITK